MKPGNGVQYLVTVSSPLFHAGKKAGVILCALCVFKSLQPKVCRNGSHTLLKVHDPLHCINNDKYHLFKHLKTPRFKAFQRWCQIIMEVSKRCFFFAALNNKMIYQASMQLFKVQK